MFTGIIEEVGSVKEIIKGALSIKLTINCSKLLKDIKLGDSIAVNGICLTVTKFSDSSFTADVMPETIRKTGLSKLKVSDGVNLERALMLSDRLGGHIVTGHIDGTANIVEIRPEENAIWFKLEAAADIMKYIINKGSVTLDGTSLTVANVSKNDFSVSLIPHTAAITTLGNKKKGDMINIECDLIGKYIEKFLTGNTKDISDEKNAVSSISLDFLKSNGFA